MQSRKDHLYLIPTSEVCLTNMYRDTIFTPDQLPAKTTSWTSCFRREAGGYGAHERGLIRIHEFEKVELVTICEPDKSNQELEKMLTCAEDNFTTTGSFLSGELICGTGLFFSIGKNI